MSEFSAQKSQAYESAPDDVSTAKLTALLCSLPLHTLHSPALPLHAAGQDPFPQVHPKNVENF